MNAAGFMALLSHWRRQPVQLLTLLVGLALATGLWSAVQAINAEARASYAAADAQLGRADYPALTSARDPISRDTYVALRRAGWKLAPVLEGRVRLGAERVTLVGVDFLSYPVPPEAEPGTPDITPEQVFAGPGVLFAAPETAARLAGAPQLPPLVRSDDLPAGIVMTDIAVAERRLDRIGEIDRILVLPDQPMGLVPLADLAPDLTLSPPRQQTDMGQLTDSFHLNLTAFGLLAFVVGLFIVHGTVGLAFEQRRAMFRTLRALGLPVSRLMVLLLAELGLIALVAGGLGLVLGYVVAAALLPDVAATLRGLYGASVSGSLTLRPLWAISGLAIAALGAGVAGAQGVWQLRSMPLLAGGQIRAWAGLSARHARLLAGAGAALLLAGLGMFRLFPGLIAGFALMAGMMLGAALMLPVLLDAALALALRRARGPLAQWFWADMRAQLPGLSLALMALLLALATNIGVGTMVSSFRLTFVDWLDQRLTAELYVTARNDEQGAAIERWLADHTDRVLPIPGIETTVAGRKGEVFGMRVDDTYRDNWPLIAAMPELWERLESGAGVMINEQLARRENLWPGARIPIGPDWSPRVAGVYADYGNPEGQVVVGLDTLRSRFDDVPRRALSVRVAPERVAEVIREIHDSFDLPAGAVIDQSGVKARSLGIFEKTFVITGALNVLTLGVAAFAILTSLLTLWRMRLPHLAPVWALGVTRRRLAALEILRSAALSGMVALIALPLGLMLAWVLLAVINTRAFGWRLPMYLFPGQWLLLGVLAVLAGALAAVLPARRLHRFPPADLVKVFVNER
ncbi:ABC transporter permease [Pontibaca methylaminivorans]|uniref:Putative ABC transport system permease protein n=1 Tax=Pontibaca methylaminivorans TaxID=515897 RepID=A0A1R3WIY2_9RHOB|nr:ABC transporter permease [Pontibaca methylaminivorans]SIT78050.1 putative ABC transport system permease protein [Pontibaca methylaminivorans]